VKFWEKLLLSLAQLQEHYDRWHSTSASALPIIWDIVFNKHNEEKGGIVLTDRIKASHILVTPAKLMFGVGLLTS